MLFGAGKENADTIRRTVREETGLTVSVGVSFCKIFAKMGSDYKKPDATTVITRQNYQEILYPLPVNAMMGIGAATAERLHTLGIETIGGLAALDERVMLSSFGKGGSTPYRYVHGMDDEPVHDPRKAEEPKSIGNSITYRRNLESWTDIKTGLLPLAESVGARLRAAGMKCAGVQVAIKDASLKKIERQNRFPAPTNLSQELFETSQELIRRNWEIGEPIRMLAVTAIDLMDAVEAEQLTLFTGGKNRVKELQLEETVDKLRNRYGGTVVKRASLLNNDLDV